MWRIVEHAAAYSVLSMTIWWQAYIHPDGPVARVTAALATGMLVALLLLDVQSLIRLACERREAQAAVKIVRDNERLRRRAYDLCASLRLGFDICEDCMAYHPDRATRELDRLRSAVGQFVAVDLGASG